jgi:hypothetical protein
MVEYNIIYIFIFVYFNYKMVWIFTIKDKKKII